MDEEDKIVEGEFKINDPSEYDMITSISRRVSIVTHNFETERAYSDFKEIMKKSVKFDDPETYIYNLATLLVDELKK